MRLFTVEDRADLFEKIGKAVIGIQDEYSGGTTPHEVVPELVNTLLLLAAFISRDNLDGKVAGFVFRCAEVAGQVWGDDEAEISALEAQLMAVSEADGDDT